MSTSPSQSRPILCGFFLFKRGDERGWILFLFFCEKEGMDFVCSNLPCFIKWVRIKLSLM